MYMVKTPWLSIWALKFSCLCVGLDINTNHIRSIREGFVFATAKPFHLGRTTQVWDIQICNNDKQLVSVNRLTMAVLNKKV